MSKKIVLLLCAALLLATIFVTPTVTKAATSSWTPDEVSYLADIDAPFTDIEAALVNVMPKDFWNKDKVEVRDRIRMLGIPLSAPATLAIIEYYRTKAFPMCNYALSDKGDSSALGLCLDSIGALRLELARLYAARGSYPPTPMP